jgi:WD40 repeat protein
MEPGRRLPAHSGGDDGKIVLWGVRTLGRFGMIDAHMGHRYSLATHPQRPFQFVSASRDETIRVWSCEAMFPSTLVKHALSGDRLTTATVAPYAGRRSSPSCCIA